MTQPSEPSPQQPYPPAGAPVGPPMAPLPPAQGGGTTRTIGTVLTVLGGLALARLIIMTGIAIGVGMEHFEFNLYDKLLPALFWVLVLLVPGLVLRRSGRAER